MTRVRVTVDTKVIRQTLASGPARVFLGETAVMAKEAAEAISPTGKSTHVSDKAFNQHWRVRPYRSWFVVENTDPFAHLVEWGSVNNPTYAPLRKTMRSLRGGRFAEKAKPHRRGAAGDA